MCDEELMPITRRLGAQDRRRGSRRLLRARLPTQGEHRCPRTTSSSRFGSPRYEELIDPRMGIHRLRQRAHERFEHVVGGELGDLLIGTLVALS